MASQPMAESREPPARRAESESVRCSTWPSSSRRRRRQSHQANRAGLCWLCLRPASRRWARPRAAIGRPMASNLADLRAIPGRQPGGRAGLLASSYLGLGFRASSREPRASTCAPVGPSSSGGAPKPSAGCSGQPRRCHCEPVGREMLEVIAAPPSRAEPSQQSQASRPATRRLTRRPAVSFSHTKASLAGSERGPGWLAVGGQLVVAGQPEPTRAN